MPCIIFDFDGTLADTNRGITETFQATLLRMGRPQVDESRIKAVIGLPLKENFTKGADMTSEEADEAVKIYRELFFDIAPKTVALFPGVKETLQTLSERGIPMAVASSRSNNSLRQLMQSLGIDAFIPAENVFGADDVARAKPAPDLVYAVCARLGIKPEQALVVGDTTFDIEMGRNAGCHTCGVSYGNQSADQLAGASPDYIIADIRNLL